MTNIPPLDRTQARAILITTVALGGSRFEARCEGQLIVAYTREPLLDGARALIAAGYHPDTIVTMRHAGSEIDALTARIGTAARFYVEESGHGPVLRSVKKAPPGAVERSPIGRTDHAAAPSCGTYARSDAADEVIGKRSHTSKRCARFQAEARHE